MSSQPVVVLAVTDNEAFVETPSGKDRIKLDDARRLKQVCDSGSFRLGYAAALASVKRSKDSPFQGA